jgi:hypothetical protein
MCEDAGPARQRLECGESSTAFGNGFNDKTPGRDENYPEGITAISPALGRQRLRWVANHKLKSTLKELQPGARNGDTTPLGLENI